MYVILFTDCKAVVAVNPVDDVERKDRQYLEKVIKQAAMNRMPKPDRLMKNLYLHAYVDVVNTLMRYEEPCFRLMKIAAEAAIELGIAEGDVQALTTVHETDPGQKVEKLLKVLHVSTEWDDTECLEKIVNCLPEEARTLAMSRLIKYNDFLHVYNDVVLLRDSLTKDVAALKATEAQTPVEVTVVKDLSEFTRKDCKEMLRVLLCIAWKIPRNKIMVIEARSGDSTTVVFLIAKIFTVNIIHYSVKASALWAFQELRVTRVRIDAFELNVVQLLSQHFKEALRNGLTGDMDFVGTVKVCGICELVICYFMVLPHSTCNLYTTSVL